MDIPLFISHGQLFIQNLDNPSSRTWTIPSSKILDNPSLKILENPSSGIVENPSSQIPETLYPRSCRTLQPSSWTFLHPKPWTIRCPADTDFRKCRVKEGQTRRAHLAATDTIQPCPTPSGHSRHPHLEEGMLAPASLYSSRAPYNSRSPGQGSDHLQATGVDDGTSVSGHAA